MAAAWFAGWQITGEYNPVDWVKQEQPEKPADDTSEDNISIASYKLDTADFAAYGISPQALEARVITVNFKPINTADKRVNWQLPVWANPNSEWAKGKIVSDYIEFNYAANYGASATVAYKQPFAESIVIGVSSRMNPELKDSVRLEYVARYDGGGLDLSSSNDGLKIGQHFMDFSNSGVYSTTPDDYKITYFDFDFSSEWEEYLCANDDEFLQGLKVYDVSKIINGCLSVYDWLDLYSLGRGQILAQGYYSGALSDEVGEFCVTIEYYVDGELIYTWDEGSTSVYLTEEFCASVSTPATDLNVSDKVIYF